VGMKRKYIIISLFAILATVLLVLVVAQRNHNYLQNNVLPLTYIPDHVYIAVNTYVNAVQSGDIESVMYTVYFKPGLELFRDGWIESVEHGIARSIQLGLDYYLIRDYAIVSVTAFGDSLYQVYIELEALDTLYFEEFVVHKLAWFVAKISDYWHLIIDEFFLPEYLFNKLL